MNRLLRWAARIGVWATTLLIFSAGAVLVVGFIGAVVGLLLGGPN